MVVGGERGIERIKMGNTSSQHIPPSPAIGSSPPMVVSEELRGSKKRKRQGSGRSERKAAEEESACALMLKESWPRTPQSLEDNVAASSQPLDETPLIQDPSTPTALNRSNDPTNCLASRRNKEDRRKKQRRQSALGASPDAGNTQPGPTRFSPQESSKRVKANETDGSLASSSGTPRAAFNLDDIDENEEGISSLFREYQTLATQLESPLANSPELNTYEVSSFGQDLIDPVLVNQSTEAVHADGKKHKGKRRKHSGSDAFGVGAEQELLNGTGQHAFDIDFEAFDEIFANEGMQLANPFNEDSGHDLPNGTEPHTDNLGVGQVADRATTRPDIDTVQVYQRSGKLPRVPSGRRPHKRRRMEVPNSLDSQIPTYISPYAPNQGQQDRVLPGLEDMQARSSSEIPCSQPLDRPSGASRAKSNAHLTQTPPPRLKHPSKPLGNKKQRGGKKGKDYNPPLAELSEKGGMFSNDEIAILETFRDRYCEEEETSKRRFNELIQSTIRGNHEVTRLFHLIYEELPYRTRQSVSRFCRRHFHNYNVRGAWTDADDEDLKRAVAEKGKSWIAVGAMIDRFPEDCRDRYRNYLVNEDKRNRESWSYEEVCKLAKAVDDCMRLLREERLQAKEEKYKGREMPESEPDSDQEVQDMKLINWQVVSERMGGTRSRLQCSYKWNHLKQADRIYYLRVIRRLEKGKGLKSKAELRESESWRLKRAYKKLKNMKTGDRHDFLRAFADCSAPTEDNIPWLSLGSAELRARWSTADLKAALKVFKKEVPGSESMNYHDVINRVYTQLLVENPGQFEDRWDPEKHGDVNKPKGRQPRRKQPSQNLTKRDELESKEARRQRIQQRKSGEEGKIKSKLFIDSDDEGEAEENHSSDDEGADDDFAHEEEQYSPDNLNPVEEGLNGHKSPEICDSADEVEPSKKPGAATTDEEKEVSTDASSYNARASETSASDTDDSLFNDSSDVDDELVDQLQRVRDA
ncbi:MAG: hypothetical protein Q9201_005519 [Fulgogasparrea decipioides]